MRKTRMQTNTRKLMAEIPADTYKELRLYCVHHERLIKDVVNEAIRRYIGVKEKK